MPPTSQTPGRSALLTPQEAEHPFLLPSRPGHKRSHHREIARVHPEQSGPGLQHLGYIVRDDADDRKRLFVDVNRSADDGGIRGKVSPPNTLGEKSHACGARFEIRSTEASPDLWYDSKNFEGVRP